MPKKENSADEVEEREEDKASNNKDKKHDSGAADLEKVPIRLFAKNCIEIINILQSHKKEQKGLRGQVRINIIFTWN